MRSCRSNGGAAAAFALVLFLAGLAAVLAGRPAFGQADVWDETTCRTKAKPADLGKNPALENQRLQVDAKILAVSGDEVYVRGNDRVPLKLEDPAQAADLREGDNIRAFGYLTVVRTRPGQVLLVKNLKKRPDDLALYHEEIGRLAEEGDMAGLFKLGAEIEVEGGALKREAAYQPVAREAYRAGIALKERAADPADPAAYVALANDYLKLLGDRKGALERVLRTLKPGEIAVAPAVQKVLADLDAVLYGGQYVLFEEMKQREGFVDRGGRWVLRERAEFDEVVEAQRVARLKPRSRYLPEYFAEVARTGNVELGMNKRELTHAIGFPDTIDRQRQGADVYDAWTYAGRGTYYFENGELFRRADAPR